MAQTFLVTPARERVLAAKAVTFALVGVLFALVALVLALAIAVPWLRSRGIDVSLGGRDLQGLALGVFAAAALWGAFGVALGAIVRSQVAAVVGVLV